MKDFVTKIDSAHRVGKNLQKALKEQSITQEQFAEMMYVDVRTVNRWINNGIQQINTLDDCAERLNTSADALFLGDPEAGPLFFFANRTKRVLVCCFEQY